MLEIIVGESSFDFWSNVAVPLLSAAIGGLLTLLGGYIQTRKDIKREKNAADGMLRKSLVSQ